MVRSVHALDVLEQLVGLVGGIVEVAGRGRRLGQLGPQLDRLGRDRVTRLEQIEQTDRKSVVEGKRGYRRAGWLGQTKDGRTRSWHTQHRPGSYSAHGRTT